VEFTDSSRATVTVTQGPKGANKKIIIDKARSMIDLAGAGVTSNELIENVWEKYARGRTARDPRKSNAQRDLTELVADGFLVQSAAGVVSLPVRAGA
jgi:rRNA processing protein Krr1/Pno1